MVNDTLAYVHSCGPRCEDFATWFGGTMFGKFALNPAVEASSPITGNAARSLTRLERLQRA